MGEVPTSLVEAVVEVPGGAVDEAVDAAPRRRITRRTIAVAVVGALVVVSGAVGGVAWADRVAHDQAVASAESAHATAAHAEAAHRATLAWLETSVAAGIASRDAVTAAVLAHQDLLGGAEAVAAVAESNADLGTTLADLLEVDAPTAGTTIPDAAPLGAPATVAPEASTDELTALATALAEEAQDADVARVRLAARADEVDSAVAAVEDELELLAAALPPVHQALLASRPLASESSKAAAGAALSAVGTADGADLPRLLETYAGAASGVIAAHDAEAARIAAEAARIAAEEAAKKARPSARSGSRASGGGGGGGGGGGTQQRGVLSETNAQRAAGGLGALSWNGTLASAACSWASRLAAADAGLSHGSSPGGFAWWGENVASGYSSTSAVVNGWMNSPKHRENIMRPQFTMMGACSMDAAGGTRYWVQQFGS